MYIVLLHLILEQGFFDHIFHGKHALVLCIIHDLTIASN
jgi:hypothetical protein